MLLADCTDSYSLSRAFNSYRDLCACAIHVNVWPRPFSGNSNRAERPDFAMLWETLLRGGGG